MINIWLVFFYSPQEDGECEPDLELEGEVEGECEAEEACEELQGREVAEDYPAVIVEEVPGASLTDEGGYAAQVFVCGDEAYVMQEVDVDGEIGEIYLNICAVISLLALEVEHIIVQSVL